MCNTTSFNTTGDLLLLLINPNAMLKWTFTMCSCSLRQCVCLPAVIIHDYDQWLPYVSVHASINIWVCYCGDVLKCLKGFLSITIRLSWECCNYPEPQVWVCVRERNIMATLHFRLKARWGVGRLPSNQRLLINIYGPLITIREFFLSPRVWQSHSVWKAWGLIKVNGRDREWYIHHSSAH